MKTLVFITSHFPFGTGETFIQTEFPWLQKNFKKIIIIAQDVTGERTGEISENIILKRYNTSTSLSGFFKLPVLLFRNIRTLQTLYNQESEFRKNTGNRLTFAKARFLLRKIIKAVQLKDYIKAILDKENIREDILFYSYWLNSGAHAIGLMQMPESIKIARAHGSDLYEEKNSLSYLPLLKYSACALDAIFFISEYGLKYFAQKTKAESGRLILSRLGTENSFPAGPVSLKSESFTVVSCSNLVPLKRIDLLISSLGLIKTDRQIIWLHFGDGPLKEELAAFAGKELGSQKNINYHFMGYLSNPDLLKYYSTYRIDLLINTSSTEGIPVSIMEAQSFGIPVIATDTGGVKEVVREGTGILLPVDFKPAELADKIRYFIELPEAELNKYRVNSIKNWKSDFNAATNYEDFVRKVNSILASRKTGNKS